MAVMVCSPLSSIWRADHQFLGGHEGRASTDSTVAAALARPAIVRSRTMSRSSSASVGRHGEDEPSTRRGGVELLGEYSGNRRPVRFQFIDQADDVSDTAAQPVELPDGQYVTWA